MAVVIVEERDPVTLTEFAQAVCESKHSDERAFGQRHRISNSWSVVEIMDRSTFYAPDPAVGRFHNLFNPIAAGIVLIAKVRLRLMRARAIGFGYELSSFSHIVFAMRRVRSL